MQYERIHYLLDRYLSGGLTETELREWASFLEDPGYGPYIQEELQRFMALAGEEPVMDPIPETEDRHPLLEKILSIDKASGERTTRIWPTYWKWAAAALVLLTAGSVGYLAFHREDRIPPQAVKRPLAPVRKDIAPGSNKAILTLAGGGQIELNGAQTGVLSQQGNTRVVKLAGGQLAYEPGAGKGAALYNTVSTPRGGQYQITLPDGTRVWLDAASSLRFPTAFTGRERTVQITGEAYFEVAPDKTKPFVVQADQTETRVLGTHFNIMAYGDEKAIKTTLLEGSVKVIREGHSALLAPGEQGAFDRASGTLETKQVNVGAAVAWKDGYYYFDRTKIADVMRQIARWYDVDVVYQGAIPQDEIVGKIPRTAYVSEVLHVMELIGIRFRIEGKKILVLS